MRVTGLMVVLVLVLQQLASASESGKFSAIETGQLKSQGLIKAWRSTYGTKDNAATMSVTAGADSEPVTQVLGFDRPSDASFYADRDSVALFVQNEAQPALLTTSDTTFTATSVTSPAIAPVAEKIQIGMLIDVTGTPTVTGTVTSVSATTVHVSNWYLVDTSKKSTTPAAGSTININPATKIWAHNANVIITPKSYATAAAGFELGLILNKPGTGANSFGYDCVNLGGEKPFAAFIARNGHQRGFFSDSDTIVGHQSDRSSENNFLSFQDGTKPGAREGFVSSRYAGATEGAKVGFKSSGDKVGFQAVDPSEAAFKTTVEGVDRFSIDKSGRISGLYLRLQVITATTEVASDQTVIVVKGSGITVTLPAANALQGKVYIIRSAAAGGFTLTSRGTDIDGAPSRSIHGGEKVTLISDGNSWLSL